MVHFLIMDVSKKYHSMPKESPHFLTGLMSTWGIDRNFQTFRDFELFLTSAGRLYRMIIYLTVSWQKVMVNPAFHERYFLFYAAWSLDHLLSRDASEFFHFKTRPYISYTQLNQRKITFKKPDTFLAERFVEVFDYFRSFHHTGLNRSFHESYFTETSKIMYRPQTRMLVLKDARERKARQSAINKLENSKGQNSQDSNRKE